jgi:hypothetical protein
MCAHRIENRKKGEEMRRKSTTPLFPEAKSEGWATRKIRGKIERSLRVGHPPTLPDMVSNGPFSPWEFPAFEIKTVTPTPPNALATADEVSC